MSSAQRGILATSLLLLSICANAAEQRYCVDKSHADVLFSIPHLGFSQKHGEFRAIATSGSAIKPIIRSVIAAFPDVRITIRDMMQTPGKIGVRAEITGTHRGALFGIAPTGKAVKFRIHEFHALDGQRVTTTWHLEDWFSLFLQIGQFPAPQP